jgi:hypothetical protein
MRKLRVLRRHQWLAPMALIYRQVHGASSWSVAVWAFAVLQPFWLCHKHGACKGEAATYVTRGCAAGAGRQGRDTEARPPGTCRSHASEAAFKGQPVLGLAAAAADRAVRAPLSWHPAFMNSTELQRQQLGCSDRACGIACLIPHFALCVISRSI